jgi:hypothetical protein
MNISMHCSNTFLTNSAAHNSHVRKRLSLRFRRLRKIAKKTYFRHVRPSVRMELLSHWANFDEIRYLSFFSIICRKIQVSLKSEENNGYCRWIWKDMMVTNGTFTTFVRSKKGNRVTSHSGRLSTGNYSKPWLTEYKAIKKKRQRNVCLTTLPTVVK